MMAPNTVSCPWWKRPIFWIVLLGLVLRLISMAFNYPQMRWQNDSRMSIPAVRLLEGKGLSLQDGAGPTAYRPPVYILWLAGAYAVFGKFSLLGPSFLQVLASSLNIYLVYALAKTIWEDERIAHAGALILAVHPYSIYHDPALYHTFLSTALLLGGFLWLMRGIRRHDDTQAKRRFLFSGMCFGTCILVISTILPFLGLLMLSGLTLWRIPWTKRWLFVGAFALGVLIPWTPWIVRNALAFQRFLPLTTDAGVTWWMGNNPESAVRLPARTHEASPVPKGTRFNLPAHYEGCQTPDWCQSGISEYDESKELTAMAFGWIKGHPQDFAKLTMWRFHGIWSPFLTPPRPPSSHPVLDRAVQYGFAAWNSLLYLGILLGTWRSVRRRETAYPLFAWTLALSGTAAYALFLYYTKYRIPFEAALIPLAGLGWSFVYDRFLMRAFYALRRSSYRAD